MAATGCDGAQQAISAGPEQGKNIVHDPPSLYTSLMSSQ